MVVLELEGAIALVRRVQIDRLRSLPQLKRLLCTDRSAQAAWAEQSATCAWRQPFSEQRLLGWFGRQLPFDTFLSLFFYGCIVSDQNPRRGHHARLSAAPWRCSGGAGSCPPLRAAPLAVCWFLNLIALAPLKLSFSSRKPPPYSALGDCRDCRCAAAPGRTCA